MAATDSTKKATVDDLVAELRLLNEKADRFEQYLRHVTDQREAMYRSAKLWFWIALGGVVVVYLLAGEVLTRTPSLP